MTTLNTGDLDGLLRFYVVPYAVPPARQVPGRSLSICTSIRP
jgi:hypothetical protein